MLSVRPKILTLLGIQLDLITLQNCYIRRFRLILILTQPSTLTGTENNYRGQRAVMFMVGSEDGHGSFYLWMYVWVTAVKLCDLSRKHVPHT